MKSCLIISFGPVPTKFNKIVEGGGLRAWGLAKGLLKNGIDVSVCIAENFPLQEDEYEGVKLINWSRNGNLIELVNSFDSIIVSYCTGDLTPFIIENLNKNVQLILDVYVPIYVEVSARDSEDKDFEYMSFMRDVQYWNASLQRGDYFICAHETQKLYYMGVLSALGRLNPLTYKTDILSVVPFGIHNIPLTSKEDTFKGKVVDKKDFVILWFGGLYPWFDIRNLIKAVNILNKKHSNIKLLIVGGKNPFNSHQDFVKQYDEVVQFTQDNGTFEKSVFFVDWVNFEDRYDWYKNADVLISLNKEGDENKFSWRTRVVDFIWGELPIVTNGGDPLSEYLIENKAAYRMEGVDEQGIAKTIEKLYSNRKFIDDLKSNIRKIKNNFYWENVTKDLSELIKKGKHAKDLQPQYLSLLENKNNQVQIVNVSFFKKMKDKIGKKYGDKMLYKIIRKVYRTYRFYKVNGLRKTLIKIKNYRRELVSRAVPVEVIDITKKNYIFLSHPLDQTGAPVVLMDIVEEFIQKVDPKRVKLISPVVDEKNVRKIIDFDITFIHANESFSEIDIENRMAMKKDDFVLMNTSAVPHRYRDAILKYLEKDKLDNAFWFIHEDDPEIHFADVYFKQRLKNLILENKLHLIVPSKKMQKKYENYFRCKIDLLPLHVEMEEKYYIEKKESDFDKLKFQVSGSSGDARKGQPSILFAFYKFYNDYYSKNPDNYRDFELHYIGLEEDFLSHQMISVGEQLLGEHFQYTGRLSRNEALRKMQKCNAVICYSLREAFGLYVAEGMFMGQIVFRNECSGVDEQLEIGKNGYLIEDDSLQQFADTLEKALNKTKTTNQDLLKMSKRSYEMGNQFRLNRYYDKLIKLNGENEDIV